MRMEREGFIQSTSVAAPLARPIWCSKVKVFLLLKHMWISPLWITWGGWEGCQKLGDLSKCNRDQTLQIERQTVLYDLADHRKYDVIVESEGIKLMVATAWTIYHCVQNVPFYTITKRITMSDVGRYSILEKPEFIEVKIGAACIGEQAARRLPDGGKASEQEIKQWISV